MHSDLNSAVFKLLRLIKIAFIKVVSTFYCRCIMVFKKIHFGKGNKFYGVAYFNRTRDSSIIIGNNVVFRSDKTSNLIGVRSKCIISTLSINAKIVIGDNSGFSGTVIGASNEIIIGKNVLVGANSLITDTNWHNIEPDKRHLMDPLPGKINIGDNVFIGYGTVILKNVSIGENSVIGAGSIVTKNIPPNVIAAGNPCVVIKQL